jgi:uncharacterized protein (DUF2267 family)
MNEVAGILHCDEARADKVTYAVFQELRVRLTPDEAADVAAQLPRELKRMWQEGENADRRVQRMHAKEFVARVQGRAELADDREATRAIKAVFRTLQHLLGSRTGKEGEAWDVYSQLPKDLKQVWLETAAEETPRR